MVDFTSILSNAKLGEIERPKQTPIGSYVALIKGIEYGTTKSEKKTPKATVQMELAGYLKDVNEVELEEAGGWEKVNGRKVKLDFWLTEDSLFRLQEFILEHVGLDMKGMSLDQALPQIANQQVGVHISHRPDDKDPSRIYVEIDKTFNLANATA